MKPVELVQRCLATSTPARGLVYEPFGGSGTTVMACEQLGLSCYAFELDAAYCDVIVSRWEKQTRQKATLEGCGATFEQARDGRRLGEQDAIKEEVLQRMEAQA